MKGLVGRIAPVGQWDIVNNVKLDKRSRFSLVTIFAELRPWRGRFSRISSVRQQVNSLLYRLSEMWPSGEAISIKPYNKKPSYLQEIPAFRNCVNRTKERPNFRFCTNLKSDNERFTPCLSFTDTPSASWTTQHPERISRHSLNCASRRTSLSFDACLHSAALQRITTHPELCS